MYVLVILFTLAPGKQIPDSFMMENYEECARAASMVHFMSKVPVQVECQKVEEA